MSTAWYRELYGYPLLTFERAGLQDLLVAELKDAGVEVAFGKECVGVQDLEKEGERALVKFKDGSSVEGDLVVGADGGNSALRKFMGVGGEPDSKDGSFGGVRYSGWSTLYGVSEPISNIPEDRTHLITHPALSYGAWPLPNKQVRNIHFPFFFTVY